MGNHVVEYFSAVVRHHVHMCIKNGIGRISKIMNGVLAKLRPVIRQKMIVEDIDYNTAVMPVAFNKALAAAVQNFVFIGELINKPMHSNAFGYGGIKSAEVTSLYRIPQKIAHHQFGYFS